MNEDMTKREDREDQEPWNRTFEGTDASVRPFPAIKKEAFRVSGREILAALLMFPTAYLYGEAFLWGGNGDRCRLAGLAFLILFAGICELLCFGKERAKECWIWLLCLAGCGAGFVLDRADVWHTEETVLFLHGFGVWYVLCRSGVLLEKKTGRLLPADAVNGLFVLPFPNFFLRIRTLFAGLKKLFPGKAEKKDRSGIVWGILAVLLALLLFGKALDLLSDSSVLFGSFTEKIRDFLRIDWDEEKLFNIFLSLPVGAYLFGLMSGALRQKEEARDRSVQGIDRFLTGLKKVPENAWNGIMVAFLLLYAAYFAVETSYYVGALWGKLPEEYSASRYAREGFFELCRVVTINFLLLWLADRSGRSSLKSRKAGKVLGAALLAAGMLLAVSAFSKILLYISRFGFTPLRLEAAWLTAVLFVGCIAAVVTLLTGKKTFRYFLFFGGLSLTAMYLF